MPGQKREARLRARCPGHPRPSSATKKDVDGRVKPGHDETKLHSELWRPLFRKRLDALLDLVAAHALAVAKIGSFLIELAAGEFVDGALHAAHRKRRVAGQDIGEAVDFL